MGLTFKQVGMAQPSTMTNSVAVAEAALKSQLELLLYVAFVRLQAGKIAALSAQCTSLANTFPECDSPSTEILEELSALQYKWLTSKQP